MTDTDNTLELLLKRRVAEKAAEDRAIKVRRETDAEIATLLHDPNSKKKSVSAKAGGLKVSVSYGVNVQVDTAAVQQAWETLTQPLQDAFKFKAELVADGVKALSVSETAALARFITTTPASPSVKVEPVAAD